MSGLLRVRLSGGEARLGRVPASDVAKLLLGVERAVARAAGDAVGRRVKPTGRWGALIEEAVKFRLVAIEEGSVVGVLELPALVEEPDTLDFDAGTLGEMVVIAALKTAIGDADDPDVAAAFVQLADRVGIGSRYDAVTFETDVPGAPTKVVIDGPARERLQRLAAESVPESRDDTLVGVLVEADFEKNTARLRTGDAQGIAVSFDADLADEMYEVLRRPAELVGEITHEPTTSRAVKVAVRTITRAEQLTMHLEPGDFWRNASIDDLRAERGVEPVTADTQLGDPELTEEEADAFLAALNS